MWLRTALRRVVPRVVRNLVRHPAAPFLSFFDGARYRISGATPVVMTQDWTARVHPEAVRTFRIHAGDPGCRRELLTFIGACTPGMRLVDVGANFGVFTLATIRYGGAGARVTAIEPSAPARRILRANLAAAGAAAHVRVVSEALADAASARFPMLHTGPGQAYMMVKTVERPDAVFLPATTLDALTAGDPPTHVKIDVEGCERDVLQGAVETLRRARPLVFLELHCSLMREVGERPEECLALLRSCGYTTFELDGVLASDATILGSHIAHLICRPAPDAQGAAATVRGRTESSYR